ncbi:MAG TPA: hypothetical protein DEH25_07900 [Chloroflexi bacterium]|nr:hypothetical protein [Chloroflexota bacterium]
MSHFNKIAPSPRFAALNTPLPVGEGPGVKVKSAKMTLSNEYLLKNSRNSPIRGIRIEIVQS